MKPICVSCERFYRPKKNGFAFVEGAPKEGNPHPGRVEPDRWGPYKLWMGDLWECPTCGSEIVVGVARKRIAERYEDDFTAQVSALSANLLVKDC